MSDSTVIRRTLRALILASAVVAGPFACGLTPAAETAAQDAYGQELQAGRAAFGAGRYAEALTRFRAASSLRPEERYPKLLAGLAAYWNRDPQTALTYWDGLLAKSAKDSAGEWELTRDRVMALNALGRTRDADQAAARLYELRRTRRLEAALDAAGFTREHLWVGSRRAGAWELFDDKSEQARVWEFPVTETQPGAEQPGITLAVELEVRPDGRPGYALIEEGPPGRRVFTHWNTRPAYAEARQRVLEVLEGRRPPLETLARSGAGAAAGPVTESRGEPAENGVTEVRRPPGEKTGPEAPRLPAGTAEPPKPPAVTVEPPKPPAETVETPEVRPVTVPTKTVSELVPVEVPAVPPAGKPAPQVAEPGVKKAATETPPGPGEQPGPPQPPTEAQGPGARTFTAAEKMRMDRVVGLKVSPEAAQILCTVARLAEVKFNLADFARLALTNPDASRRMEEEQLSGKYPFAKDDASELVQRVVAAKAGGLDATLRRLDAVMSVSRDAYADFAVLTALNARGGQLDLLFLATAMENAGDLQVRQTAAQMIARSGQRAGIQVLFKELDKAAGPDGEGWMRLLAGSLEDLLGPVLGPCPAEPKEAVAAWRDAARAWWQAKGDTLRYVRGAPAGQACWVEKP